MFFKFMKQPRFDLQSEVAIAQLIKFGNFQKSPFSDLGIKNKKARPQTDHLQ